MCRRSKQPLAEAADAALVRKVVANLAVDQEGADPRSIVQLCIAPRDRAAVKRMHRAPTGLHVRLDSGERRTHKVEEDHVVRQGEAGTLPGAAPHRAAKPAIDAAIEHILAHEQIGAPRPHIPEHRLPPLRNVFLYFTRLPQNYQGNRGKFQAVVTPRSRRGSAARTGTRHTPVGAIHESPASLPFHPSLPCAKGGGGVADGGIVTKLRDNPSVT